MSVFTPDSNIVKETINVNYSDRRTAQKVIFINRENEYYGTTKGKLDTNGGIVKNATISACNIIDRNGNKIELGEIVQKLDDVSATIDQRISSVYDQVDFLSGAIDTVSGDVDKLKQMSAGNLMLVGELSVLGCTTFKNIFTANGYSQEDVIQNGYMYMLRTEQDAVVENVNITDKDFIITKTDELSVKVKDLNAGKFMFIDAMDKSLVQRVAVLELSAVESDSKITTLGSKFTFVNGRVDELSTKVDGFVDQRARIDTISTDLNTLEAKHASDMGMAWEQIGRVRDIADHVREDMDDLSQDLDSEISTREEEDADIRANLKLSVDNLLSGQSGDVGELTRRLNKEIQDRISGDTDLNTRIDDLTAFVTENYATKDQLSEVDGKFANYTTTSDLDTNFLKKTDASSTYLSKTDASSTYLSKTDASTTYATKTALETVDGKFANYTTTSDLDTNFLKKTDASNTYLTKTDASTTYATKTALETVDGKFSNYTTTAVLEENYLSKTDASTTYATKTALETVDGKFANYTTTSDLDTNFLKKNDASSIYLSKTDAGTTYASKTELANEISTERDARIAKDNELEEKIGGGYGELTALVDAERIRAEGAEGSLRSDLDDALTSILSVDSKIDDEIERAIGVEAGIADNVQTISVDLATTKKTLIGSIDYRGHVRTDKYGTEKVDLSTVFHDYLSLDVGQGYTFKNGWIYWFTNDGGVYETKDGLRIKDKDYVLIHSHADISVDISNVGPSVVDIISYNGNNIITKEDLDRTVAQIDERIDDAITAIEDLDTRLTEEITRAGQAESGLGTRIDNAFTAINDEKTRARDAEGSLRSDLDDALTSILSVDSKIDEEKDRATGIEDILSGKIDDALTAISSEKTRAEGVEDFLSGKIDEALSAISDEKDRAESIEGALDSKIDGVYEDLLTAVSDLQDKIDEEVERASAAENTLSDMVDDTNAVLNIVSDRVEEKVVMSKNFDSTTGTFKNVDNIQSFQVIQLSTISEFSEVSATQGILSNAIYLVNEDALTEYQKKVAESAQTAYNYLSEKVVSGITIEELVNNLLPVLSSLANVN